ncbi:NAD(+) diphosphatase [Paucibacter soli]|uniref:NAD(+) diphosphatase n=1 Tax=Paucibacter soli TaxID=3133433 RepID=UPI003099E464
MHFIPAVQAAEPASAQAWYFVFFEGQVLLPADLPLEAGLRVDPGDLPVPRHYLGRLDGLDCWTLALEVAPADRQPMSLRAAMMALPEPLMALAGRAAQVLEWDRAHRFCGACGTPTERLAHERARRCPACAQVAYPRLSPAMMALVWRRPAGRSPELLLARGPQFKPGFFSALAGFVEPGESLEQCLHREVAEEVGVQVKNLRYYGSQSWPFPHSLMVAYTAEWAGGEIVPQPGEIEDAGWFPIDALPGVPPRFSISGHLIEDQVRWLSSAGSPTP